MHATFRIEALGDPNDGGVHRLLVELSLDEQTAYDHPKETRAEVAARTGPLTPTFTGENVAFVARDLDGRAIGICWCVLFDPGTGLEGEVAELFVEPAARGQGVATALVEEAMRLFQDHAVTFASVWTHPANAAAMAVYRRAGFAPTEQAVLTWLPLPGRGQAEPGHRDNHDP